MRAFRIVLFIFLAALCGVGTWLYCSVKSNFDITADTAFYVTPNDTRETIEQRLTTLGASRVGVQLLTWYTDFKPSTGHYLLRPSDDAMSVVRRLKRHEQDPVRVVIPSVRLVSMLPSKIAQQLMMDSADIARVLADTAFIAQLGYDNISLPSMIVPNTYEVYWDVTPTDLVNRLKREGDKFWNTERQQKAKTIGLTRLQVATLASIVAEETRNKGEKPTVAGLYMNRLHQGMKLQADPTVKFASGDFALRRILNKHLTIESPYNTYLVKGLPPGPIRIPDIVDIDAVLNYSKHDYIYMCAKEDFCGTHNFARTWSEHTANARRYVQALNQRGIK